MDRGNAENRTQSGKIGDKMGRVTRFSVSRTNEDMKKTKKKKQNHKKIIQKNGKRRIKKKEKKKKKKKKWGSFCLD